MVKVSEPKKRKPAPKRPAKPRAGSKKSKRSAEAQKRRSASERARHQERTRFTQDVGFAFFERLGRGPKDKRRRERCRLSFRKFCETYFPKLFALKWSRYHLEAIQKIEDAVLRGQLFAFAMPRGSGKTSLCRAALLWASLYGHSLYPLLITATAASAKRRLESLKKMLRLPPKRVAGAKVIDLADDFPEIILPIRHLGNESSKAKGQKFFGTLTDIEWTVEKVVYPSIDFDQWPEEKPEEVSGRWISRATALKNWDGIATGFGAILDVASMEGEIRGRSHTRNDGSEARPDLAVADDPQTKRTARSPSLTAEREEVLSGEVMYLGGPDKTIGVVVPCTVIYEDDLADRLLNEELHPEYRGTRSKMVDAFPEGWEFILGPPAQNESDTIKSWRVYRRFQLQDLKDDGDRAVSYYASHQTILETGFSVTWAERKKDDEISAIQHAINLFFKGPAAFYAEAQNEPQAFNESTERKPITVADLQKCKNGIGRGVVPDDYDRLVGFIDVQGSVLWWTVVAVRSRDFSFHLVDFGAWPKQATNYYQLSTIRSTLQKVYGEGEFEAVLSQALTDLADDLTSEDRWSSESGDEITLDALGVDSGWGEYAVDVYKWCRRDIRRAILYATKGVGIKATNKPMVDAEAKPKKGRQESLSGQWKYVPTRIRTKLLRFDANFAKSKMVGLFRTGIARGNAGGFSVFEGTNEELQMLFEHLTAEKSKRVKTKDREVDEFFEIPGRDNHLFDCVVGSIPIAHRLGAKFPEALTSHDPEQAPKAEAKDRQQQQTAKATQTSRRRTRRRAEANF